MPILKGHQRPIDRFPPDRWNRIFTMVPLQAVALSMKHGLSRREIFHTRFFCGYLAGFPTYLDEADVQFGAAVRKGLFDALFGQEAGRENFQKVAAHLTLEDEQTTSGAGYGWPDGQRFFEAVELDRDPYQEDTFSSLDVALELGFVDFKSVI